MRHWLALPWKRHSISAARSFIVRSTIREPARPSLPHSHGFTDSLRVIAPPQLIRGASNPWTFTCSWSTRGVDRGPAKVSEQTSSTLNRFTRSRGIRDPAILFGDCQRIRDSYNLQVIRAKAQATRVTVTFGSVSLPNSRIPYWIGTPTHTADFAAKQREVECDRKALSLPICSHSVKT